jgi:hypothetical protein
MNVAASLVFLVSTCHSPNTKMDEGDFYGWTCSCDSESYDRILADDQSYNLYDGWSNHCLHIAFAEPESMESVGSSRDRRCEIPRANI